MSLSSGEDREDDGAGVCVHLGVSGEWDIGSQPKVSQWPVSKYR